MPKKSVVASLVGNFSPVNRRTASFVSRIRHFRGEIGEELNKRASTKSANLYKDGGTKARTILKDRGPVQLEAGLIRILILLRVTHDCRFERSGRGPRVTGCGR